MDWGKIRKEALLKGVGLSRHCTGSWGALNRIRSIRKQESELWRWRLHLYLTLEEVPNLATGNAVGRALFASRTDASTNFVLGNSESQTIARKRKPQLFIK